LPFARADPKNILSRKGASSIIADRAALSILFLFAAGWLSCGRAVAGSEGGWMARPRFAPGSLVEFKVKNRSGVKSLAAYLASRLGVVESWAADLVAGGHVACDGRTARPGDRVNLSAGPHEISVRFPEAWPRHMAAVEMPLDILYEDPWLIGLAKPPGIVVHPARGHLDGQTLQNGVRHRFRSRLGEPGACLGPPHRLDKDTSGVVLFALTREAYRDLAGQFSRGRPRKQYLAVLDGRAAFDSASHGGDIGPDPARPGLGKVQPPRTGGKAARTDFRRLEAGRDWSLVEAVPRTGRPHQIRVHAADLGLPLAGDRDYNPLPGRLGFPRQALHAAALEFDHPIHKGRLRLEAPPPADWREALLRLRRREAGEAIP
jgi:23S rRNA pseudouridine1911/1915/1917 synthase